MNHHTTEDGKPSTLLHTPGTWQPYFVKADCHGIDPANSREWYEDAWDVQGPAILLTEDEPYGSAFTQPDARLIAAAPALLDALRALVAVGDGLWVKAPEFTEETRALARALDVATEALALVTAGSEAAHE